MYFSLCKWIFFHFYLGFFRKAQVKKCKLFGRQKEGHGPRHRFRKRMIHELTCLKACQISKVHACSYERTNEPCTSSNYKTLAKIYDHWLKNKLWSWDEHLRCWKKSRNNNGHTQNSEDEANRDMQLDKEDTQQSILNSKYLGATHVKISWFLLFFKGWCIVWCHRFVLACMHSFG